MDLISLLNSRQHIELKSEEEILNELREDHQIDDNHPDPSSLEQKAKCGRVLISTGGIYSIVCDACNDYFDGMDSFSNHLKTFHSDYGIRKDGWIKVAITEEPTFKTEEIDDQECVAASISLCRIPEYSMSKKSTADVPKYIATRKDLAKVAQQGSSGSSKIPRKPTGIITHEPIYDGRRLFCITCDRQLNSKKSFLRHKYYHKERICEQGMAISDRDSQEDASVEATVKTELDFGDYEIQNPALPTVYNEGSVEISDTDDNAERGHADSNDSLDLHFQSQGNLSENIFGKIQNKTNSTYRTNLTQGRASAKERTLNATFSRSGDNFNRKIELIKSDMNPSRASVQLGGATKNEKMRRIKTVFSKTPTFDDKKNFCITCNRKFASRRSFNSHKYLHRRLIRVKQIRFCCEFCPKRFKLDFGLREHIVANHGDEIPKFLKDDPTNLECRFCFKQFEELTQRYQHEQSHGGEKRPYRCSLCVNSFSNHLKRKIHKLIHRKDGWNPKKQVRFMFSENPKFDDKKRFCITCNCGFATKSSLDRHKQEHRMRIRKGQGVVPKARALCASEDAEEMKLHPNNSMDSHCFSEDSSQTSCGEMQSKIAAIADTHIKDEMPSPDEYTSSSDESDEQYAYMASIVFTLEPEFNEEQMYCVTCNCQLDSKEAFRAHKEGHKAKIRKWKIDKGMLPKATISCEFCPDQFGSELGLRKHAARHHGDMIPTHFKDDPTYLKCRFCHKQFEKPTERYAHEKSHAGEEKQYKCPLCPKSFKDQFQRRIHESLHRKNGWKPNEHVRMVFSENPQFDDEKCFCITCNRQFGSKDSLRRHKRTHLIKIHLKQGIRAKVATYCEFCTRQFKSESGLRQHLLAHHGDKIPSSLKDDPTYLQCKFCFKQFDKPTERYRHEKNHPKVEMPYQCPLCPQLFTTLCNRKYHELTHKGDGEQPKEQTSFVFSENPKFDDKKCFCITCNRKFVSKESLYRHKRAHKMKIRLKQDTEPPKVTTYCEFCSRYFKSEDGLRRHLVTHHGDKIPSSFKDDPAYLQCKFCFKQFEKPTDRHRHEESHPRKERPYKCPQCPQFFTTLSNRKSHEVTHKGDGRKPAQPISIVYSENPEFDDEKIFCITCNRGFASKVSFYNHKQKHRIGIRKKQGILPKAAFRCELCSKKFMSDLGLRQHIVQHHGDTIPASFKGDPTYLKCRFCHKQFEKPTDRYSHEKIHANEEKPYKCSTCSKVFGRSTERKTHETVHSKARPFRCTQCPNSYKILSSLNRHIQTVHSD